MNPGNVFQNTQSCPPDMDAPQSTTLLCSRRVKGRYMLTTHAVTIRTHAATQAHFSTRRVREERVMSSVSHA